MADLLLTKPEAGQRVEFQNVADARLVLGFSPSDATLERVEDDLVFVFDDGSTVVLNDFYTAYNSSQLPDFQIDGIEVAGADFFAALDSNLMPAAGPAAGPANATGGGRYQDYGNTNLMGGIDRLDGLDIGFNSENPIQEDLGGFGGDAGTAAVLAPRVPMSFLAGEGAFELKERGVGGADPNAPIEGVWVAEGFFTVNDNTAGGPQNVTIIDANGNVLNAVQDPATGILTADHPYGILTVTPVANGDGSVTYRYSFMLDNERADTLNQGQSSNFTFNITVTNGLGESVSQPLDVTLNGTNDRPELKLDVEDGANIGLGEDDTHEGTFTVGDADSDGAFDGSAGNVANQRYSITGAADAEGNTITGTATDSPDAGGPASFVTEMGTLTVYPDGRYTFVPSDAAQGMDDGDTFSAGFNITVKDAHGANHSQNINISITGSNDTPVLSGGSGQLTVTESNLSNNTDANANNSVSGGTPSMSDSFTVKDVDVNDKQQLGLKVMVNGSWVTPDSSQISLDSLTGQLVYHSEYGDLTITPQNATASTDASGNIWLTPNDPAQGITYNYEFKLDNERAEGLNQGENPSFDFKIQVSDGDVTAEKDVNVTINGANDIPLMGSSELTVSEAGVKDANGDPNASFAGTEGVRVPGQIPPLNGNTFDPDNADADLNFKVGGFNDGTWGKGENELSFTLTRANGSTETVQLEILNGEWQTVTDGVQTIVTNYGVLTLNTATGAYDFVLGAPDNISSELQQLINDNIGKLSQGDKLNFSFQATVSDGDKAGSNTIGITINGTNDRPELNLDSGHIEVGEDSTYGGTFTVGDADADGAFGGSSSNGSGDVANQRYSITGGQGSDGNPVTGIATDSPDTGGPATFVSDMGTLTINPDGSYTYVPSELAQALGRDESYTENFTITVKDVHGASHEQDISITLKGGNDGPTLEGGKGEFNLVESNLSSDEGANFYNKASGGTPSMSDSFTVKDVDVNDKQQLGLKVMVNGSWVTPDPSQISLDSATGQLVYHSEYGDLTITPQNATASTDASGNIWLTPNDPSQGITYNYEFKLDQDKSDSLNKGENPRFDFKIEVSDGESTSSKDVTVNIEGTNDIPLIAWSSVTAVESGILDTGSNPNASYEGNEGKWLEGQVPGRDSTVDPDNDNADLTYKVEGFGNSGDLWNFGKDELNFTITRATGMGDTVNLEILNDDWQTLDANGIQTIVTNYGVLKLNPADGSYKFLLGAPEGASDDIIRLITNNIQNLGQGDKLSFGFQVTVSDGDKTGTHIVGVSVLGTNDAPELSINKHTLEVTESGSFNSGGKRSDFGNATGADDDIYNSLRYGFLDANGKFVTTISDEYGTIKIDAIGRYTYTLNNTGAVQGMTDGDEIARKYTVVVKDEHGALSNKEDVTVTIKGADDAPVITKAVHVHNVVEEGVLPGGDSSTSGVPSVSGKVTATDVDKDATGAGQKLTYSFGTDENDQPIFTVVTEYGIMTINPDTGAYTYTLTNDADAVNKLPAGATHEDRFTVTVTDPDGNKATQDVQINVKGTNDQPEIDSTINADLDTEHVFKGQDGVPQAGLVTEDATGNGDGKQTFTGKVIAHDVDTGETALRYSFVDAHGNSVQSLEGDYGYITIDPVTGQYTYTLYNDSEAVQKLGKGDFADEKFDVRVTDHLGASSTDSVHIKVEGSDDAPSIGGDLGNSGVVEDNGLPGISAQNPSTSGTIDASDVDSPNNADGAFRNFYFKDANGNPTQTIEGEFGRITIDADTGKYTYELTGNGDLQGLNFDTGEHDQFKVYVKTGYTTGNGETVGSESSADLTINIKGANDNPEIKAEQSDTFESGGNTILGVELSATGHFDHSVTGKLVGADVDDTAWTFHIADADGNQLQSGTGLYGSLVIAPDGSYTYQVNPYSLNYVGILGMSAYEKFTVTVYDQHGGSTIQEIQVKVNGVAPAAMPDGKPDFGGLPANPNSWKWSLDVKVTEDSRDGSGLVSGEGDLKLWHDNSGQHDAILPKGVYSFLDADNNLVQSLRTEYGLLRIDPDTGKVSFVLDNELDAVQSLKAGDKLDIDLDGVRVTINGNAIGKNNGNNKGGISITVEGVNDTPEVADAQNLTFVEGAGTVSGTVVGSDVDDKTTLRYYLVDSEGNAVESLTLTYGIVTIDPVTGKYTFTPAEGWEHKNADWADTVTITVRVDDQSGTTNATVDKDVSLNLKGTNTGPELTVEKVAVTEDDSYAITGKATAIDDTDGLRFRLTDENGDNSGILKSGTFGSLVLDPATGEYTYRLNNNHQDVQGLGESETRTDTFYVTVTDKHGATETREVTITINGTNDAPQLFVGSNLIIQDDGTAASASATATARDLDFNDTLDSGNLRFSFGTEQDEHGLPITTFTNAYGTFTIDPTTGEYSFTLNPDSSALMKLTAGQMHTEKITITVSDSSGGADSREISVHIKGTNSAPDVKIDTHPTSESTAVVENTSPALVGTFTAVDWDGSIGTVSMSAQGQYGNVTLLKTAEGQWKYTYTLNGKAEALAEGERAQDTFTIKVTDNQGKVTEKTVTVDVLGTNEAPVASSPNYSFDVSTMDDAALLGAIGNLGTDIDAAPGSSLGVSFTGANDQGDVVGNYGTLHFNSDTGSYSYSLNTDASNLQTIAEMHANGLAVKEDFGYSVSDNLASASGSVTVNIGGSNTGDADADHSQLLLGNASANTLHGGSGDDYLSGGAGNDALYGGDGDDMLFGGTGNDMLFGDAGNDMLFGGTGDDVLYGGIGDDYLDGGAGSNQLYGGAGNDILVFSNDNVVMDGGAGIDFLIGADSGSLDSLIGGSSVAGVEVFITDTPAGSSLTSMSDLAGFGITVQDDKLNLSTGWHATDTAVPDGYAQYMNADGDMTIVVQKAILENGNG